MDAIRLIETWDVLKYVPAPLYMLVIGINRNMGCIEIGNCYRQNGNRFRLIETWDVLK